MAATNEINIGCVVYSESPEGIQAEWISNQNENIQCGTGVGNRVTEINNKRRFEGDFEIIYLDEDGRESPKLNLTINYESGYYQLTWKIGNEITDVGIGIERDNKLFASYQKQA